MAVSKKDKHNASLLSCHRIGSAMFGVLEDGLEEADVVLSIEGHARRAIKRAMLDTDKLLPELYLSIVPVLEDFLLKEPRVSTDIVKAHTKLTEKLGGFLL